MNCFDSTNQNLFDIILIRSDGVRRLRLRLQRANQAYALYARFALTSELGWQFTPTAYFSGKNSTENAKIPLKNSTENIKIPLKTQNSTEN